MSSTEEHPDAGTTTHPLEARIARYDQHHDPRLGTTVHKNTNTDEQSKHLEKLNQKKPVIVVRRVMDSKGQHTKTEIDIRSQELCKVLMEIHRGLQGLDLLRSICDLKLLFFLLQRARGTTGIRKEEHKNTFADFQSLTRNESITFDLLWTLFRYGTLVFNHHEFTEQDHILRFTRFEITLTNEGICAAIHCHVITHDGEHFRIANQRLLIPSFEGERKIQSLSVFPLLYHSNGPYIRELAAERGRRFASLQRQTYGEISGMTACVDDRKVRKYRAYGRVMIDPGAFRMFKPESSLNLRVSTRLKPKELEEEQYMICTPVLLGFCFGTKQWGGFALDKLVDVSWSLEPFDRLVLDNRHKELIHALVKQHASRTSSTFDDFVRGKGKGLVGLLAGPPGCGKTLTAEAAAEVTKHHALAQILELSQRWKAVVLLDEADVFLSQRRETDVERNALVSIFLRQLEYYQGIMFLTTNLVSQCDAAFESRIHFTVHYPPLCHDSRKQIWKTFIDKTSDSCQSTVGEAEINALSREILNGRQIKNTVGTALSLSLHSNTPLSETHIHTVLDSMQDWNKAREHRNSYLSSEHKSDLRVGVPAGMQSVVHYIYYPHELVIGGDLTTFKDIEPNKAQEIYTDLLAKRIERLVQRRGGEFHPPIGCYLDEDSILGGWIDSHARADILQDHGVGHLDPYMPMESFNPDDDCDLEPFIY
ncbi:P-loop containing nucleoside triphosphate hydrolase protein [Suillus subalutaceus]|uniref:P-loop containing nucleoside triphosphate hydrolase protein n=1 Tax=Suillus subalutaceus TaxID=48586 RepID=UPI001B871A37|nr:P-loop containing nucleoside triphosphate hydrolase protein [Suillus subalutaceus]KAG1840607.1 P-loop containing nucleoside triphosphate hydrolase protein [Suillus subalutaceus]